MTPAVQNMSAGSNINGPFFLICFSLKITRNIGNPGFGHGFPMGKPHGQTPWANPMVSAARDPHQGATGANRHGAKHGAKSHAHETIHIPRRLLVYHGNYGKTMVNIHYGKSQNIMLKQLQFHYCSYW